MSATATATLLYRIASGGSMTITTAGRLITYEIGHEIELTEADAARLNENRRPGDYRVVRVDGELAAQIERASRAPWEIEIKVSELGTQTADELRGAGITPSAALIEAEAARAPSIITESGGRKKALDEPGQMQGLVDQLAQATATGPPAEEAALIVSEPASEPAIELAPIAAEDEVAPDWATYLAGVTAADAAETLRTLESADDVQTALDAEAAGLRRPLVIRTGNSAIRKLRKT